MSISYILWVWLVGYVLPFSAGIGAGKTVFRDSFWKFILFFHLMLATSVAVCMALRPDAAWYEVFRPDIYTVLWGLWSLVSLAYLGRMGAGYAVSAMLQQASIVAAAHLLLPVLGLPVTLGLLGIPYACAHDRRCPPLLRFVLIPLWGIVAVVLWQWLGLFWLNVLVHAVLGACGVAMGLLLRHVARDAAKDKV